MLAGLEGRGCLKWLVWVVMDGAYCSVCSTYLTYSSAVQVLADVGEEGGGRRVFETEDGYTVKYIQYDIALWANKGFIILTYNSLTIMMPRTYSIRYEYDLIRRIPVI